MLSAKVVILNWNGCDLLERFLPAVVENTPPRYEIVVADNGSTDGSAALVSGKFPGVRFLPLDRNYGFAGGYNHALAALDAEVGADCYILLNNDAAPAPGWAEKLVRRLDADESVAACTSKILAYDRPAEFEYAGASGGFIDGLGYPFCRGRILSTVEKDEGQYDDAREVMWGSGACLAVRAEAFRQAGGFDDAFFAHMEEIDLCWRMQLAGHKIYVEPASVIYHLGGGTLPERSERKIYLNFRNTLLMLYKNLSPRSLWPVLLFRMALDAGSALVYLVSGRRALAGGVWRAHREFWKMRPGLKSVRREIAANAVARPAHIYRGSILLRYALGGRTFGRLRV